MNKLTKLTILLVLTSAIYGCQDNQIEINENQDGTVNAIETNTDAGNNGISTNIENNINKIESSYSEIMEFEFDKESIPELRPFCSNNLEGYINKNNTVAIEPNYAEAYPFDNGYAIVAKDEGIWSNYNFGVIDSSGNIVIETKYDSIWKYKEGIYKTKLGDKGYIINTDNQVILEGENETIRGFCTYHDGYSVVYSLDGCSIDGCSVINEEGNTVIGPNYSSIDDYNDGMFLVEQKGLDKYGINEVSNSSYIDLSENILIGPYDFIGHFHEDLALFITDDLYGYLDKQGNIVIEPQFEYAYSFNEGIAFVDTDGDSKYGAINTNGEILFEEKYCNVDYFFEGHAVVTNEHNTPLIIDTYGKIIYKAERYPMSIGPFSNGLAAVSLGTISNEKCGYIDYTGNIIIPLDFDYAGTFIDGVAEVKIDDIRFSIDLDGNRIF